MADVWKSGRPARVAVSEQKPTMRSKTIEWGNKYDSRVRKKWSSVVESPWAKDGMGQITELEFEESMANITPNYRLDGSSWIMEEVFPTTLNKVQGTVEQESVSDASSGEQEIKEFTLDSPLIKVTGVEERKETDANRGSVMEESGE